MCLALMEAMRSILFIAELSTAGSQVKEMEFFFPFSGSYRARTY